MSKKSFIGEDGKEYEVKEKVPFYKKKWFIAIAVLFLIGSCSSLLGGGDEEKKTETKTEEVVSETETEKTVETEAVEEESELDVSSLSPEERVQKYAKEVFKDNLIEVENYTGNDSLGKIIVSSKFSENSLSGNTSVFSFLSNANKFLEKIQNEDFESVFFDVEADFTDAYGNTSPSNAVKMEIEKSDVDKINFENFDFNNLPNISKTFEVHPGVGYKGN